MNEPVACPMNNVRGIYLSYFELNNYNFCKRLISILSDGRCFIRNVRGGDGDFMRCNDKGIFEYVRVALCHFLFEQDGTAIKTLLRSNCAL